MPTCNCPITKTLDVFYQVTDPPATANHVFRWRVVSDEAYTTISPNPTPILVSAPNNYKVQLPNIPVCQDVEVSIQRQCANNQNSAIQTSVAQKGLSYGCTQSISGTYTGSQFYVYPAILLDLSTAPDTVKFNYFTVDKNNPTVANPPNRFTIKNSEGVTVFNSDWKGQADYPGPWPGGTSTLNTPTCSSFSFNRGAGCFYTLIVDTVPNGTQTDVWSLTIDCTNTADPPVDPTIDIVSCTGGLGRYTISGTAGTTLKVGISASGQLVNTNTPNNCARIDVGITSSTGPTVTEVSPLVTGTGTTSVGTGNTVFLNLTIPASGYIIIDTEVIFKNSPVSDEATATLTIFEVNGAPKSITRSLCIGNATTSIPCNTDPPSCVCPSGYTANPDNTLCIQEETIAATAPTETTANRTLVARSGSTYGSNGAAIYSGYNATTGVPTGALVILTTPFWINETYSNTAGPLNRTAVWTSLGNINNQTISFSTCINISQTKTYLIGVGCDNYADIKLNGVNVVTQDAVALSDYFRAQVAGFRSRTEVTFMYWHVYPVTIPAGNNVLQITGTNVSDIAGVGVEIYDATAMELSTVASYTDLGPKLLFSTKDLRGTIVSGGSNGLGYSCPTGYVLKACGLTTPVCYKATTANCITSVVPITLTALSCLDGYGSYKITASAGTTMKVSLSVAGSLTNTNTDGYCAKISATIAATPGLTANAISNSIQSGGTATVGANNSLFVSITFPSNGIVIINTQATAINSTNAMVNGAIRIFEINGVAQASSVDKTLSVCIGEATGVAICT